MLIHWVCSLSVFVCVSDCVWRRGQHINKDRLREADLFSDGAQSSSNNIWVWRSLKIWRVFLRSPGEFVNPGLHLRDVLLLLWVANMSKRHSCLKLTKETLSNCPNVLMWMSFWFSSFSTFVLNTRQRRQLPKVWSSYWLDYIKCSSSNVEHMCRIFQSMTVH